MSNVQCAGPCLVEFRTVKRMYYNANVGPKHHGSYPKLPKGRILFQSIYGGVNFPERNVPRAIGILPIESSSMQIILMMLQVINKHTLHKDG